MAKTYVLGISAFYHDSAAAMICDGEIVAAASEERFTRVKGDASFPIEAITFCLDTAKILPEDLAAVVYYEDPVEKFGRLLTSAFIGVPKSVVQFTASMPDWISSKLWIEKKIRKDLGLQKGKVVFLSHHLSHAASAFYPSPFDEAAILTVDGVGEWTTMSWGVGKGNEVRLTNALRFPNSLGLLYSAFTFYTGFKINEGEYKMMGLAPYGEPKYADLIKKELIRIEDDGSFVLNQKYFSYAHGVKTINKKFEALFGQPPRGKDEPITDFHADVAASIQQVTNEILLNAAKHIREQTGMKNLVMAGGVALNVTSTGALRASGIFDGIWIQPAAGDAGGAVGAALHQYYRITDAARRPDGKDLMKAGFLGYEIKNRNKEDDEALQRRGAVWTEIGDKEAFAEIAKLVSEGKIVSVAWDRAEFGPRALGNRSILADARDPAMLQHLNARIKFREGFRPFAPAVLAEDAAQYFDIEGDSPYMIFTFPVKESRRKPSERAESITKTASLARSDIPSVTHIDYSARIETVNAADNPKFHAILTEFKKLTGCSVMINTSYNVNHQPIVNNAVEAYDTFMKSGIDFAFIGGRRFDKAKQPGNDGKGGKK
ncbi:MAG: hypothetical protein IJK23_00315 [Clostridia bacterium]|nr:hypothetical protein [Clostridia bacterium]